MMSAFLTWHYDVQEDIRSRNAIRRVAIMWMNRNLSIAFNTWMENSEELGRIRGILSNVAKRMFDNSVMPRSRSIVFGLKQFR